MPASPHNSSTPLISSDQRQDLEHAGTTSDVTAASEKDSKRRFFGWGKKKEIQAMDTPTAAGSSIQPHTQPTASTSLNQLQQQQQQNLKPTAQPIPISPSRQAHHASVAASPSRLRSSSPRLHSPASSEIFERNVQEPVPISTLGGDMSDAHIPAHVMTEDSIPPALEASAQAITSEELNPDEVEIVTSASHQPAGATLDGSSSLAELSSLSSPIQSPPLLHREKSGESESTSNLHQPGVLHGIDDDGASNYGQLDPNDVRRLSFISFKDIVHSEHQQAAATSFAEMGSRDGSLPSSFLQDNRAASPFRPPRSQNSTNDHGQSGDVTTPPTSANVNAVPANAEQSPARSAGIGASSSQHGELTIETMRQALRKTASGDLSGVRSAGMSPMSDENPVKDALRSRTNT